MPKEKITLTRLGEHRHNFFFADDDRKHVLCSMKTYTFMEHASVIVGLVENSGINFKKVEVVDSADAGMKFFSGTFSWQRYCEEIMGQTGLECVTFCFADQCGAIGISYDDKDLVLITEDLDKTIQDFIDVDVVVRN